MKKLRVRRLLSFMTGAAAMAAFVSAVITVCSLYTEGVNGGGQIYTPERIAAAWQTVSPFIICLLVLTIITCCTGKRTNVHREKTKAPDMPPAHKDLMKLRAVFFVLAGVLITLGLINGGLYDVFVKAINICTECIGLG